MVGKTSFHFKSRKSFSAKPTGTIKRRPEVLDQVGEKGAYHSCKAKPRRDKGRIVTLAI